MKAGTSWVHGADQVIESDTYHTATRGGATLMVYSSITQDILPEPPYRGRVQPAGRCGGLNPA